MKKAILLLLFLNVHLAFAQEVPLNTINSTNVLDFYHQLTKAGPETTSVSVAVQVGDSNIIEVVDRSESRLQVIQLGNNNTTLFMNSNPYPTNAEINVRGSNNYINIEGSNSISEGMKMNINANDMTVLMRNR